MDSVNITVEVVVISAYSHAMSAFNGSVASAARQDGPPEVGVSLDLVSAPTRARVLITGAVPISVQAQASRAVSAAFQAADVRDADARVRLTWDPDDRPRPAVAQVNADVGGRRLRAQISAGDLDTVVESLVGRVRVQLAALDHDWAPRVGPQEESTWPARSARPGGERELVRNKTFRLARCVAREAMRHMDAMDYDFHLYESLETGEGSLVYRIGPTGYRLATSSTRLGPPGGLTPPLTWHHQPATRCTVVEALELLNRTDYPFVFFFDGDVARVLYRRFDGHYGLISGRG